MQDLLLILLVACLPLATWSGYRIGKKRQKKRTGKLSDNYFTGLNFLLNEQPDKAIDAFIEQLQVNSDVVETHLALGNLFRRRGEVDRATRIHQNLIARPSLTAEVRKLALMELAHDYLAAGLYDRAESLFKELSHESAHRRQALSNLISVYQQLQDWKQAINCTRKLAQLTGKKYRSRLVNYHCEMAADNMQAGQIKEALTSLKEALNIKSSELRPNLMLASHYMTQSDYRRALKLFKEMASRQTDFLSEFLPDIHRCHIQLGSEDEFVEDLQQYIKRSQSLDALVLFISLSRHNTTPERLVEIMEDFCQSVPTADAMIYLVAAYRDLSTGPDRGRYEQLHQIVSHLAEHHFKYGCHECGYQSMTLFWQCPACKEWGTLQPVNNANKSGEFPC